LSSGTRTLSGFLNQTEFRLQRNREKKAGIFKLPGEGGCGKWLWPVIMLQERYAKNPNGLGAEIQARFPGMHTCWWHQGGQIYAQQNVI